MDSPNKFLYTQSGGRYYCISHFSQISKLNFLFVPPPGLGSESLYQLARIFIDQVPGNIWLMDHPNDGTNIASTNDIANWPQALIEVASELERPIIIGHSTGGMFIQSLPELESLVRGIVLIASAPDMNWKPLFDEYMKANSTPEIEKYAHQYFSASTNEGLRNLIIAALKFNFMPNSLDAGYKLFKTLPVNYKVANWSDQNFDPYYKAKYIPNIPVLILSGEKDQIIPVSVYTNKLEYQQNNIIITVIDAAGHYPWFDQPQMILQAFQNFIFKFKLDI